jgi:hypothetical protein
MAARHIVRSYDEELDLLKSKLSEMGKEVYNISSDQSDTFALI